MHACMHTYIHTYIHACMHAYICSCVCVLVYVHTPYNDNILFSSLVGRRHAGRASIPNEEIITQLIKNDIHI